ncbi:MAG: hypothetical protein GXP55_13560 [Deltaproteobacteria bacterium]|nr:hypothetical protein [Deltaproteobacteria bacterium]
MIHIGGVGEDSVAAVAALGDGRIVVVGTFENEVVFGESGGDARQLVSMGGQDAFVAVFAADGSMSWVRQIGGIREEYTTDVVVSDHDRIYVLGTYEDSEVRFGNPESPDAVLGHSSGTDVFLVAYDSAGTLDWVQHGGGRDYDASWHAAVTSSGGIVVTGAFQTSAVFDGVGVRVNSTDSFYTFATFAVRYESDGTLAWARSLGAGDWDSHMGNVAPKGGVAALEADSIAVTGPLVGQSVFGAGESREMTLPSGDGVEAFILRLNARGELVWLTAVETGGGTRGWVRAESIAPTSDGDILLAGAYAPAASFGVGEPNETTLTVSTFWDGFVARYRSDGSLLWVRAFGSDRGVNSSAVGTGVVQGDWVVGYFAGTVVFGGGDRATSSLSSADPFDGFLARYGPTGDLRAISSFGGSEDDVATSVTTVGGSVVVAGEFGGEVRFGGAEGQSLWSAGGTDGFVAWYVP